MVRLIGGLLLLAALAGCEVYRGAEPEVVSRAAYTSEEPASVTLISMVNNKNDRSAHSALVINGSQRVIYDPAGTFQHPDMPRRDDIHYGVTPRMLDYYERYHARFSHHAHSQTVYVSRETADQVLANAQAIGRTPKMLCAGSVTGAIRPIEPFTEVRGSIFPETIRRDFTRIAGVENSYVYESDVGKNNAWVGAQAASE